MPKEINTSVFPNDPIGVFLDGTLSIVKADDPPFRPKVVDDQGTIIEVGIGELANSYWRAPSKRRQRGNTQPHFSFVVAGGLANRAGSSDYIFEVPSPLRAAGATA
jgi:hypothetical protein